MTQETDTGALLGLDIELEANVGSTALDSRHLTSLTIANVNVTPKHWSLGLAVVACHHTLPCCVLLLCSLQYQNH